jgi:hypothetical protein
MPLTLHLISHTHWDREWYLTFQQFRLRLVHLLDELLEILAEDPSYRHFLLDGQTIVLDDYLQIRPEREPEIRELVEQGRLSIGPWHILPDEFLVSPEATLRNLLQGERTARRFGGKMKVGYIPDPFGHIGQLPQILRGFGIDTACLQRGLSDEPVELLWQAPDGSTVFLAYLRDGYGNAYALPADSPQRLLSEVQRLAHSLLPHSLAGKLCEQGEGHLLFMQGTDHMRPPRSTPAALAAVNNHLPGYTFEHSTLARYMQGIRDELEKSQLSLPVVLGELRSGKRHPLLPGVMSARMWIKQRNTACENLLEKWAEPFSTWAEAAGQDPLDPTPVEGAFLSPVRVRRPAALLRYAWRLLMENHPHDSICGCSVDAVHEEMKPRFDQVEQIGEEITRQSLAALADAADTRPPEGVERAVQAVVVFNPVSGPRTDWVQVKIPYQPGLERLEIRDRQGEKVPHQVLSTESREVMSATLDREGLKSVLQMVSDARLASMAVRRVDLERQANQLKVNIFLAPTGGPDWPAWEKSLQALQNALEDPDLDTFVVQARTVPEVQARFLASQVPMYGLRTYWVCQAAGEQPQDDVPGPGDELRIQNDLLELTFSAGSGVFSLSDRRGVVLTGLNRFVDGGDCGDEYNFAPPEQDSLFEAARVKSVRVETGPLQQSIEVQLELPVPLSLSPDRRSRSQELTRLQITTRATLTQGVPRVDFVSRVENPAQDHRLRVHFPFAGQTAEAEHDGHFQVVRRPVGVPEAGPDWIEQPRPEVHQRAFTRAAAGGVSLTLANRGLPEVEVRRVEDGEMELSLTLLRCVGWLSRDDFSTRRGHAGPMLATPGAQMQGSHTFEYALILGDSADPLADYRQAYAFASPLRAAAASLHAGDLPGECSLVNVTSPAFQVSAVKATEDDTAAIVVRGYNLSAEPQQVSLSLWRPFARVERTALDESTLSVLEADERGQVSFTCRGHEIVTLKFSE